MKSFLLLIWLRGDTKPNSYHVAGTCLGDALNRFFATVPQIGQDKISKLEIYP